MRVWPALFFLVACAHQDARSPGDGASDGSVQVKVVYEKMPDGSIKKTTITTRTVGAPPPSDRPADPYPSDALVKYNVERVNAYRAQGGLPPLKYDAKMSSFARKGSEELSEDHTPHAHFHDHIEGASGFGSRSAENQGDPSGVPALDADAKKSGKKQIDLMLKLMMDEGPGGGHYDNIMNGHLRRIGIGLVYAGGKLYLTNDFSD